ncbi:MAG: PA0069 family radical SAM protein [Shimia sp.]
MTQVNRSAKGRGAAQNPANRFQPYVVEGVDDGWEQVPEPSVRTEVRTERIARAISRNTSPDLSFDRSVNPYRGCEHGCIYCFARPSHAYLDLSPGLDFETRLIARPTVARRLEVELRKPSYRPDTLALGTNTDPYQPIEREHRLMRKILEVLAAYNHPTMVTTKGVLIERDLDILGEMAAGGLARVGVSITTLDPQLSRQMEPRVPGPARRLKMIQAVAEAGIDVRVLVSPVIPGLTDHELENILSAARDAGATGASWAMLRLPLEVAPLFTDWLHENRQGEAKKVMARVREAHGGKDYDPQWYKRLRGEGLYAQMIAQRFRVARARLGLDAPMTPLRTDLFAVPPRPGDQLSLF